MTIARPGCNEAEVGPIEVLIVEIFNGLNLFNEEKKKVELKKKIFVTNDYVEEKLGNIPATQTVLSRCSSGRACAGGLLAGVTVLVASDLDYPPCVAKETLS
ncbi:hypothetical protein J6590_051105 [Homalodisca vitripennis]|nr:hypothetical protein J6590_051105 [Homalodisca vitripennis]